MPTSAPKVPATPRGPGVGGTREWVITRPAARGPAMATMERPVFLEMALAMGLTTTKPESQKMGMETMKPVRAMAQCSRFLPKSLMKVRAIRSAAPVLSKIWPIITPKPMMMPMLPRVPPKPLIMALGTSAAGRPPPMPMKVAEMIRARKGCTLVIRTKQSSRAMPIIKAIIICIVILSSQKYPLKRGCLPVSNA